MNRRAHEPADLGALSGCAEELAEVFVSLASDIALVIDDSGVIMRVAQSASAPMAPAAERWVGRHWVDTVTGETRRKIELLLDDASASGLARRREVNHGGDGGGDIPVAYTAMRLGKGGPVLAVGRDLRAIAAIQQRFQETQQELERSYWKARHAESHHDLLVQVATDAVLVVDARTLVIKEADATASDLLAHGEPLCGQPALHPFDAASRGPVRELLLNARSTGRPAEIHARLAGDSHAMVVSAAPFRARDGMRLLLRVRPLGAASTGGAETRRVQAWRAERLSEAVVVTDSGGKVLAANPPFLRLVQASDETTVRGRPIADWLGHAANDVPALMAEVHEHGVARLIGAALRSGADVTELQVFAVLLADGDQACFGFTMRPNTLARPSPAPAFSAELVQAVAELAAGIGSQTLDQLLLQAQRLARRHLTQAALARCHGDAAAAAALLGTTPAEMASLQAATAESGTAA
ncbi:MAG TPA: PAS domain-containing protein [Rubrivivax sp.]|nr:PAS domain-containing protein [Rubrivivax sp.]